MVRLDGQPWTRLKVTDRVLVAASPETGNEGREDPDASRQMPPSFEFRGRIEPSESARLLHGLAGQIRFELPSRSLWQQGKRIWFEFLEKRGQV